MIHELELVETRDLLLELRARSIDSVFIMCPRISDKEFPVLILATTNNERNITLCETALAEFVDSSY